MDEKQVFIDSIRTAAKKELTPEEVALFGAIYESNRSQIEAQGKAYTTTLGEKLGDFGDDKTMAQRHAELLQTVESMRTAGGETMKGFWGALRSAMEEKKDDIMATRNSGSVKISLREAGTITMSNITAPKSLGARDKEVDAAATLPEFLPSQLITQYNLGEGSNPWVWMQRAVGEGAPAYVTEGNSKPAMDYDWTESEVTAKVIAAYVPISKIAQWNYPALEAEVRSDLMDQLTNKFNDAIINGAGTTEINGIFGYYATELDLSGFTAGTRTKITAANFYDVLALAWQASRKKVRGQRPDTILISIDLAGELDLQKDKNGQYLFPQWFMNSNKGIKGARVIECEYIGDRQVLVGSFPKAEFNFVKSPEITVGWINDQFIKNQYCILCEFFGMQRVKTHKNNFIKVTDIDAALETIDATV